MTAHGGKATVVSWAAAAAETVRTFVSRTIIAAVCMGCGVRSSQRESCGQVCDTLRTIALRAADAVLQMHYCAAYDSTLQPPGKGGIPTNNWMRVSQTISWAIQSPG